VKLLLDTGVLGLLCHPRKHDDARQWLGEAVAVHELLVPEVADYELPASCCASSRSMGFSGSTSWGACCATCP
jgi:hypothetical protein